AAAVALGSAVSDAETRALAAFMTRALGQAAQQPAAGVEVQRLTVDAEAVALLLRSPEPIDWSRVSLELLHATGTSAAPQTPGVLKLTDVAVGGPTPNDETVTVLAREQVNLAGTTIEQRALPGPLVDSAQETLLDDRFTTPA